MNQKTLSIIIKAQDEASAVMEKVNGKMKGFSKNISEYMSVATDASKRFAVGLIAAGTAMAGFVGFGAKIAGDIEAARAGFVTLLGSTQKADEALEMIKKDAAATPFELPGLISANQLLTSVTKDAAQSEKLLMNVGKALSAMGKGQPELDRIIVNLQQIGAVGKASLMDVRQFAFAGIPIFDMLKDKTGLAGEALEDFISNGGVTFELLEEMFNRAGSAGGEFADAFKNQAGGFNQILSNLKDNIGIAMSDIVKSSGAFEMLKSAMSTASDWIENNSGKIAEGIKNAFKFIQDNGPVIAGVILGALVPAFVALAAGVWATLAPLLPFMVVGGALALLLQQLADKAGGWSNLLNIVTGALKSLWDIVAPILLPALRSLWGAIANDLLPSLKNLWDAISPVLVPALKVLAALLGGALLVAIWIVIDALTAVIKVISSVIDWFTGLINTVRNVIGGIISIVGGVAGAVFGAMSGVYSALVGPFQSAYDKIAGIVGGIKNAISGIKNAVGGAIDKVAGIKIPGFATGVRNFSGGLAVVGERGPELVNLPRGSDVFTNSESRGIMSGGGQTFNMYGNVMLGDASAVDRYYERFMGMMDKSSSLGEYGVGI